MRGYLHEKLIPTREQFHEIIRLIRESGGRHDSQAKAKNGAGFVEVLLTSDVIKKRHQVFFGVM